MSIIKIVEGTAAEIETAASLLDDYDMESFEYLYHNSISGRVSNKEHSFYVAVFRKNR